MSDRSAGGLADALSHLLQLTMLEKSGRPTDVTHRELLRDRIKQYVQTARRTSRGFSQAVRRHAERVACAGVAGWGLILR